jgi:hypothetical protein
MIFIINDSEHSMDCVCFGCDFFLRECRLLTSIACGCDHATKFFFTKDYHI